MSERIRRRDVLAGLSTVGTIGIAGCSGGNNSDSDSSGSNNEGSTDTTSTESGYDPQDYYGLPECDGSRPIRLIAVNSDGSGIIQNMRGDDQLVYVKHDDSITSGDYCGGTIVEGGEQTAYEVPPRYGGEPSQIEIGAVEATSRNRDAACSQSGALPDGDYSDGCVDPNSFRGYQDVSQNSDETEVTSSVRNFTSALFVSGDNVSTDGDRVLSEEDPVFVNVRAEISDSREPDTNQYRTETALFTIHTPTTTYEQEVQGSFPVGYTANLIHNFAIEDWEHDEAESIYADSEILVEYDGETTTAEDVTGEVDVDIELDENSGDSENSEASETSDTPIEFANVEAELTQAHSPIPPVVEWSRTITNNRNESMEISFDLVVEHPETPVREERTREIEANDSETTRGIEMPLDEWEENTNADSRDARAEEYRSMFEESNVFIEYDGETWDAEKSIDERTSYP